MNDNLTFYPGGDRVNVRTAAVMLSRGRVLVSRDVPDAGYCFLPGGRVQRMETAQETICRELGEELKLEHARPRLLWVAENLFYSKFYRRKTHEFCFFYLVEGEIPPRLTEHDGAFFLHDDADRITIPFRWVPLDTLSAEDLRPAFLKQRLCAPLPSAPEVLTIVEL